MTAPSSHHADHVYQARTRWTGSTGAGYRDYSRRHEVETPPVNGPLTMSSDVAFRGDPEQYNPEQLLLAAASSCQLLAYLALAARHRLDVQEYRDEAEAVMPNARKRMRITRVTLRPHIVLAPGSDRELAERLVHQAHEECFIANTLDTTEMAIEPEIVLAVPRA